MDVKYYPRDAKKVKEREFLSLKQGNMRVMEYVPKFNELSRFPPTSGGNWRNEDRSFWIGTEEKYQVDDNRTLLWEFSGDVPVS